jgi:hypothetical protein
MTARCEAVQISPHSGTARLLIDLKRDDCLWPVGVAPDGRHLFCGAARSGASFPYCAEHDRRARSETQPGELKFLPAYKGAPTRNLKNHG